MNVDTLLATGEVFFLAGKAIFRNQSRQILLLHSTPRKKIDGTWHTYWDLPSGRVHRGETVQQALVREIEEETSIKNTSVGNLFTATNTSLRVTVEEAKIRLILFVYFCSSKNIDQIKLSEEHQDYCWINPKKAAKLLNIKYPKEFTNQIKNLT